MNALDRRILRLAVPNVLSAISVPLMGAADTAMIGRLPEVAYMGAVSTATLLFGFLFWSTAFLRMGTTSVVAQYFGAGDRRACAHMLYRSLAFALVVGGGMVLAAPWVGRWGFALAGGSEAVQHWGLAYFGIRCWEAPLVLALFCLNGFFLGTANAWAPMTVTIIANAVNVAADYALIFGRWGLPEMGVEGAAWASVIGNATALAVGLGLLAWRYGPYLRQPLAGFWEMAPLRLVWRTNLHLFGRTLCLQFAQFFMLGIVSRLGEVPLAANAVIWQLWGLSSFGIDGMAHAAETLVGNELGARRFAQARRMAGRIIGWGLGLGGVFAALYLVALEPLAWLFTEHEAVVATVVSLRLLIALVQPLNAVVFVYDGIFIGANDMRYLFAAMAVASFGFYLPLVLGLVLWWEGGMVGAWLAYNGLMVGRFATLWPRYRSDRWLRTFVG